MLQHGAIPLPRGAWASTFGDDNGVSFSVGQNQCAFAYRDDRGKIEVIECDVEGLGDVDGKLVAQAVVFPCPCCGDSMRVAFDDKPFTIGDARMFRSGDGPVRYRTLTVETRIVCDNKGVSEDDPNLMMQCDWDVVIYKGVAFRTAEAMALIKQTMDRVNAGLGAVKAAVVRLRNSGVDGATLQQWDAAVAQTENAAAQAFARALSGQYAPYGPTSVTGTWAQLDHCAQTIDQMMKSLNGGR